MNKADRDLVERARRRIAGKPKGMPIEEWLSQCQRDRARQIMREATMPPTRARIESKFHQVALNMTAFAESTEQVARALTRAISAVGPTKRRKR